MAGFPRPAGQYHLHAVHFTNGGRLGVRNIWAFTGRQAARVLTENPSCFGLTETVHVLRVERLYLRDQGVVLDERRAAA